MFPASNSAQRHRQHQICLNFLWDGLSNQASRREHDLLKNKDYLLNKFPTGQQTGEKVDSASGFSLDG